MSTPRTEAWDQASELVDAALQLPEAERARYLDDACSEPRLRAYVDSLILPFLADDGDFLAEPALPHYAKVWSEPLPARAWHGRRIGDYRIEEQIGEGGMGVVFRGSRADDQYQKQVAIKLLKEGYESSSAFARFRSERQILANLQHPNIARLLDGGETEAGLPYLVMELIDGQPVDQYCDSHKLGIDDRLGLFCKICSAVEYAHQNLVIHRDLKPGNVLVTAEGVPTLLDFGIARLLSPEPALMGGDRTVGLLRVMTPEYASPEQVRGESITTASDVYSLGVLLYLLLSGHRPYHFAGASPVAVAEVICHSEPTRPSVMVSRSLTRIGGDGSKSVTSPESVCGSRGMRPEKLRRRLSGDLDNVLLKALRKEPQRRYASVGEFSRDIQLHLQNLPVRAHQDTFSYRSVKFMQRHKTACVVVALFLLTLAAGVLATLHQARIARSERARADRRFNDVRHLANALMFDVHDSIQNLPGSTIARKLLVDRALQYLDGLSQESSDDPSLLRELATAYQKVGDVQGFPPIANLGDYPGALASYDKALRILQALDHSNPDNPGVHHDLATVYYRIAWCLEEAGDFQGALASIRRSVPINESESLHRKDARTLDRLAGTYGVLAVILTDTGDLDEALMNYKKAVKILTEADGSAGEQAATLRTHLAGDYCKMSVVYELEGQLDPALQAANEGLGLLQQLTRNDPLNATLRIFTAEARMMAASIQIDKGQSRRALNNLREAQRSFLSLSTADPSNAALSMDLCANEVHIGEALLSEKLPVRALASFTNALAVIEGLRARSGPHDDTAVGIAQADLGIARAHWMLATASVATANSEYRLAQSAYGKSLSIWSEINGRGVLAAPNRVGFQKAVEGKTACERVLAAGDVGHGRHPA